MNLFIISDTIQTDLKIQSNEANLKASLLFLYVADPPPQHPGSELKFQWNFLESCSCNGESPGLCQTKLFLAVIQALVPQGRNQPLKKMTCPHWASFNNIILCICDSSAKHLTIGTFNRRRVRLARRAV